MIGFLKTDSGINGSIPRKGSVSLSYVVLGVFPQRAEHSVCANKVQFLSACAPLLLSVLCTCVMHVQRAVVLQYRLPDQFNPAHSDSFIWRHFTAVNENVCSRKAVHYKFVQTQTSRERKLGAETDVGRRRTEMLQQSNCQHRA